MASFFLDGNALQFASARCRADKVVVTQAVRSKGEALSFASEALLGDQSVLVAAIEQNLEGKVVVRTKKEREAHEATQAGAMKKEDEIPGGRGALI